METDFTGTATITDPDVYEYRIQGGVSITGLKQARLGEDPELTLAVKGGPGLSTTDHSADMDAPEIDGFEGVALMREGPGAITQTALVYSNAERSVRAFDDVYSYNRNAGNVITDVALTHRWVLAPVEPDDTLTDGVSDLLAVQDPGGLIKFEHELSTTGVTSRMLTATVSTGTPLVTTPGTTVRGTYDGIPGEFSCGGIAAANCTISLLTEAEAGMVPDTDLHAVVGAVRFSRSAATALLFKADDPDTVIPDRDYLAFGVWQEVPHNPTLANPGRVRPFATGNAGPFTMTQIMALRGSASYSGGAVGHYATRAAGSHLADMGRFTADVSLDADFDTEDPLLSGTIDGFMSEEGMEMPGWVVTLSHGHMDAADLTNGPPTNRGIDVDGTTSGSTGSLSWSGVWEAWFFGTNKSTHPTGIAGNFQADAGTPQPITTQEGRINLFADEGFAGVVGSFGGKK